MKYLLLILALTSSLLAKANSLSDFSDARDVADKYNSQALTQAESNHLNAALTKLGKVANLAKLARQTTFVCIGAKAGLLASGTILKCSTLSLQTFTIDITGIELAAEVSGNLIVGIGNPKEGIHDLQLSFGLYKGVGGMFLRGAGLTMLGLGVGWGGHLNYGVPSDSLFGGQIQITVN